MNALTIDVEDYFHVHAFSDVIHPDEWDSFAPTVEKSTYRILDLLDSVTTSKLPVATEESANLANPPRATFFVLGWVAERYPTLIKEIHARGHEVACHGYNHQCIFNQTEEEFREDVARTKGILEDLIGVEVIGYRAPTYSVTKGTLWALEILSELGFYYDSSIFPIKHDVYGLPESPSFPFYIDFSNGDLLSQFVNPKYLNGIGTLEWSGLKKQSTDVPGYVSDACFVEFPVSTLKLLGRNIPFCGGGYFRLFPYCYVRWGLNRINKKFERPAVFYIHPWELNPGIPKINNASWSSRFRTYVNLKETESKFTRLLHEFSFAPIASIVRKGHG